MVTSAATVALADSPAWTFIEAGYSNVDPDDLDSSGDNFFGGASLQLFKQFHVAGRFVDGDFAEDLSQTTWNLAAGWHGLLGEGADLFAEATWTDTEIDTVSDSGVGIIAGVRWRPIGFFEADGIIHWTDYDLGSEDSYELRAMFYVWRMGLGASALVADDAKVYSVFARFNFNGE